VSPRAPARGQKGPGAQPLPVSSPTLPPWSTQRETPPATASPGDQPGSASRPCTDVRASRRPGMALWPSDGGSCHPVRTHPGPASCFAAPRGEARLLPGSGPQRCLGPRTAVVTAPQVEARRSEITGAGPPAAASRLPAAPLRGPVVGPLAPVGPVGTSPPGTSTGRNPEPRGVAPGREPRQSNRAGPPGGWVGRRSETERSGSHHITALQGLLARKRGGSAHKPERCRS
jgi:hypothetical protein